MLCKPFHGLQVPVQDRRTRSTDHEVTFRRRPQRSERAGLVGVDGGLGSGLGLRVLNSVFVL